MIALVTFFITLSALFLLTHTPLSRFALDAPNHRSLHKVAIPRSGGVAMMLGLLVAIYCLGFKPLLIIICGLAAISLFDDKFDLSAKSRLFTHILLAIYWVNTTAPTTVLVLITLVLALVWMTNLYNFMDGSDGMAGGMAFFGFSAYAIGFHWSGMHEWVLVCLCVVATACAFLLFNFHPAKIFMGDAGSIPLGFLAGSLGIYGWHLHCWLFWFPVLVFSPFIVDATVTLIKRLLKREKVWQAHREHYYQRLIQLGWGHRKTALYEYVVMLGCSISALIGLRFPQWSALLLGAWYVIYILMALWIDKQWKMKLQNNLG
jgi:UDP-GlcNAc:undecaprenyl-phosphate/decaprenyl-phosphate GlcNAc-1-phosphate transferase